MKLARVLGGLLGLAGLSEVSLGCAPGSESETDEPAAREEGVTAPVLDVAVGGRHACALMSGRTVQCWGANDFGQLGDGTKTTRNRPAPVVGLSNVTAIGVGNLATLYSGGLTNSDFSCALVGDGSVWCWGADMFGQLGVNKPAPQHQTKPVQVWGLSGVVQIAVGGAHACALLPDATAKCWGFNTDGQVGYGGAGLEWATPIAVGHDTGVLTNVARVVAGQRNTCAILLDHSVRCWGNNFYGSSLFGFGSGHALTDPDMRALSPRPTHIPPVSELALGGLGGGGLEYINGDWRVGTYGGGFGCAKLLGDGSVWCWGSNHKGQMGSGSTDWGLSGDITTPTKMSADAASGTNLAGLALGGQFGLAIRDDSSIVAWGAEDYGELADGWVGPGGDKSCRESPTNCRARPAATQAGFKKVAAGAYSACGIRTDGSLACWGLNVWGQLGDGTNTNAGSPVAVAFAPGSTCAGYADVPADHMFCTYIAKDSEKSVLRHPAALPGGCSDGNYCPDAAVTRLDAASLVVRGLVAAGGVALSTNPTPYFWDVPSSSPYFVDVQTLKELGITAGCSLTDFFTSCPSPNVTRGQMAVFLMRAKYGEVSGGPPMVPAPVEPYFDDVPPDHGFYRYVQQFAALGITSGCGARTFCVDQPITRGQAATFVARTFFPAEVPAGAPPPAPPPNSVFVTHATYGANLGLGGDNATAELRTRCRTTSYCPVSVDLSLTGNVDPAPGWSKDFQVTWVCPTAGTSYAQTVPAEAYGQTVVLSCP